jgi:hypothetical protein
MTAAIFGGARLRSNDFRLVELELPQRLVE